MLVITEEQRQKRRDEFDQQEIDRLIKQANRGNKMAVIILQSKYGLDGDYLSGYDDGEQPERQHD